MKVCVSVNQPNPGKGARYLFSSVRYTGDSNSRSFVPFNGRILAEYYWGSSPGTIFDHPEEIGLATTATDCTGRNVQERLYYPFGEMWNGAGSLGMHQEFALLPDYDPETDQYNTPNRHYNPMGRWMSPDPLGGDLTNPQSLNRYAYVTNNPTTLVDPLGLQGCPPATHSIGYGQCAGPVRSLMPWPWWDLFDLQLYTTCPGHGEPCTTGFDFSGAMVADLLAMRGTLVPTASAGTPQTPRQAATQYCQEHGELSFNIPLTNVPVTVSMSATLGPVNYGTTNDFSTVFPLVPWPEWLSAGASLDITINAPSNPTSNPTVGLGKNLSVGYFTSPNGPQGLSLSLGPSIGPPINLSVPTNNGCGMAVGGH